MTNPSGATGSTVNVQITSASAASAGAVVFRRGAAGAFANSITVPVPVNGTSVPFLAAGRFGRPSTSNGDVRIEGRAGNTQVGSVAAMVRIRKNANTLTPAERDRFVAAFAQLNNQGLGRFADFRDMHTNVSSPQAHGAAGFLPWHRAYLLDLERELQAIDPSVALPYWRFDRAAPNLFQLDFLGVSDSLGTVRFSNSNPLQFWRTDGVQGINRRPFFNTGAAPPGLLSEAQTLALGTQYRAFRTMEGNPHGMAHRQCCPGSAVLPAPLQRRSAVGQVAAPERPVQCSAGRVLRPGRASDRSQPWRHDVAVERRHRKSPPADGARRSAGRVTGCRRAGSAADRAQHARLPRRRQRRGADGVRLRRRRVLEHIPFGWNQPNGICLLQQLTPVRAFPL